MSRATAASGAADARRGTTAMRRASNAMGLAPFAIYVLAMFALPTALVVSSAFRGASGEWTIANFAIFRRPGVAAAFVNSLWLSALTAAIGAILGALVCYALLGCKESGAVRRLADAAASTLSQFGGVMLAFAFIATLGNQGMVTLFLRDTMHLDIYEHGVWLYTPIGLVLPYVFFQMPLMIVTFYPAMARLPRHLSEAVAILGASAGCFWRHVGIPMLLPSFMSGFLLLFANAFSAYATAAALISQGSQIAPLQVRAALISETGLGSQGASGALAVGMLAIMTLVVCLYAVIDRKASSWLR
ncbi:ABC transporter permease [Bifidobacterium sp. AGR2158]|uniref:ABC transporter permease n=1 Tax=Bifidobacterium sp. AGR2158 TaxID=1280675 RepID=UPI0009DC22FC|nr:ABC transporter permease subunit [Bifidobacterium sp. AGR2158]